MATVQIPAEQRFVLSGVSWPEYVGFGDLLGERHVRVTYDRGEMEFMTLSPEHERVKHFGQCDRSSRRDSYTAFGVVAREGKWHRLRPIIGLLERGAARRLGRA